MPLAAVVRGWRRLTSMRTALVLLLLLALAALPGSLLPQRPLNPIRVDLFRQAHPSLGRFYDRLGLFDVFATPWFAAVYLLLLVTLVGCLAPRIRLHARALRAAPPAAPRHLDRLPLSTRYDAAEAPEAVAAAAAELLRSRRWRVTRRDEPDGIVSVAAEKGYLRETGNLLFHLALVLLLASIAVGRLYGYQGTVLVEEGKGFCTTVSQFDGFRAGWPTGPGCRRCAPTSTGSPPTTPRPAGPPRSARRSGTPPAWTGRTNRTCCGSATRYASTVSGCT